MRQISRLHLEAQTSSGTSSLGRSGRGSSEMCMAEAAVPAEHGMALDGTGCAEETECAAGMAWPREAPL